MERDRITAVEWAANQATVKVVRDEDAEDLRVMLKGKLKALIGSHPNPLQHSIKMTAHLIELGFLAKPEWHDRSTLTLEHFGAEELAEAYGSIKNATKGIIDEYNPF